MKTQGEKQGFRADCHIALVFLERGEPAKRALGCELRDISGRAWVKYRKFLGKGDFHAALGASVLEALALAANLHKEAPELLFAEAGSARLFGEGLPGEKQLREQGAAIKIKLSEFRGFHARIGTDAELAVARELAEAAFARD